LSRAAQRAPQFAHRRRDVTKFTQDNSGSLVS
jgi:hypothetical protein